MGLAERFKCIRNIKENKKTFSRLCSHVGLGAAVLGLTVTGVMPMALVNAAKSDDNTSKPAQIAVQTKPQTKYAVESWWKAGIEDYELVEYTHKDIEVTKENVEKPQEEVKYPDISFEVTAAQGAKAAEGIIYPHAEYGTRDISKEYYTVRSVDTGEIISDNAYDLVCRVLAGELYGSFSDEAMKAQTVAIYSYIRYCDANGMLPVVAVAGSYSDRVERIVKSVEGQVCSYGGAPINALFCASTGGNSIGSEYVWSKSLPYMKPVVGKYDNIDPNYGVKTYISAARVKSLIEAGTDITLDPADVQNWFEITGRSYGKYVTGVKIAGKDKYSSNGTTEYLTGAALRDIIGTNTMLSTAFDISYSNGTFCFTTYGYGHGVGMSQWGAQMLSTKDGLKYDQILRYYYSGTAVGVSSVNKAAEERYGKLVDISGLQEASPSDSTVKAPESSVTEQTDGKNSEEETITATETSVSDELPADVTTPEEGTSPTGSESSTAEVTTPAQTAVPTQEVTAVSE